MKLTQNDLQEKLDQQLRLIHSSIEKFDQWLHDEALHLATRLRVLLHDNNPRSWQWSLLWQLWLKDTLNFYDSSFWILKDSWINSSYNWLVLTFIWEKTWVRFIPVLDEWNSRFKNFDDRWEWDIFIDMNLDKFSRKDIVLFISDQDWWAHLDSKIKEKDANLIKRNSLWIKVWDGKNRKDVNWLEYIAVRQITHEILKSLNPNYTCKNDLRWEPWYIMWGNISFW